MNRNMKMMAIIMGSCSRSTVSRKQQICLLGNLNATFTWTKSCVYPQMINDNIKTEEHLQSYFR